MNVLIDLDGTLLDFNKGERNAILKTIKEYGGYILNDDDIDYFSKINEYYFNEYKIGNMLREEFHYMRFKKMYLYLKIDGDIKEANKYYVNTLKYEAQIYDDVIEALDYLKLRHKLYIASNGMNDVQIKRLEIARIIDYFEKIYVSEKIGFNKPDVNFFNYIFKDLNDYNKNNYIIIGDRLDSDVLGGINSSIKTIYLNRDNIDGSIKADFEIKSLKEIKDILW